eukprot:1197971-Amorphochlora_amoeboformis.AAC.1
MEGLAKQHMDVSVAFQTVQQTLESAKAKLTTALNTIQKTWVQAKRKYEKCNTKLAQASQARDNAWQ